MRLSGKLRPINMPKLTGENIEEMCYALLTEKQKKKFEEELELDFALELEGLEDLEQTTIRLLGIWRLLSRIIPLDGSNT